jgi:hypothetical protein
MGNNGLQNSNTLSRKSRQEPPALEYRINWEIYTPYASDSEMLLHINRKFFFSSFGGKCGFICSVCVLSLCFIYSNSSHIWYRSLWWRQCVDNKAKNILRVSILAPDKPKLFIPFLHCLTQVISIFLKIRCPIYLARGGVQLAKP